MNDQPSLDPETTRLLAGDRRRAVAAIAHFVDGNQAGVNAMLKEAAEADRVTPFILMLLDCIDELSPALHTDTGRRFMQRHIARLAGMENAS